jgi:hypothetical protein
LLSRFEHVCLSRLRYLGLFMACLAMLALPMPAKALDEGGDLTSEQLRELFVGKTFTGLMGTGMPFSEYYAPDGRILGHNDHVPVTDGCWEIVGGEMCYSYGVKPDRRTYCWAFRKRGQTIAIVHRERGVEGLGRMEEGNGKGWGAAKAWSCQPMS